MLRTLGATRPTDRRLGAARGRAARRSSAPCSGSGSGCCSRSALIELMRALDFPVGDLVVHAGRAASAARRDGAADRGARRAPSGAPRRAHLADPRGARRPRACAPACARAAPSRASVLIGLGLAGRLLLGAADETTPLVAAAGMSGTIAIFFGIALIAPFVIRPLVRVLSLAAAPACSRSEGRLAADAARSDPGRTAATATALMIGLALVVAVNSLGASFLKSISDEFDRSLRPRPHRAADRASRPAQGPQQTIAGGASRPAREHAGGGGGRPRALPLHARPAGPEGRRRSADGLLFGVRPRSTTPRSTRPTSRGHRARRSSARIGARRGDGRQGLRRGGGARGRRHDHARGPSGSARARVAGIVETVVFGGQTVGMSLRDDAQGLRRHRRLRAGAEGDAQRTRGRRSSRKVERIVARDYPNLAVLSNEELKADVEDAGERAVRDLLRDRRRRDLRQPVRDHQHAHDVGDRAHPRDRRPARARRLALAGPPPGRRREPGDRADRGAARDRGRHRARLRAAAGTLGRRARGRIPPAGGDDGLGRRSPGSCSA